MSLYTQLAQPAGGATAANLERCLDGNLCRCTGYRPLLDAAKSFASDFDEVMPKLPANGADVAAEGSDVTVSTTLTKGSVRIPTPLSPELAARCLGEPQPAGSAAAAPASTRLVFPDGHVHRPSSVSELLALLGSTPTPRLFQGAFDGVDLSSNVRNQAGWIDVSSVQELHAFTIDETGALEVGSQTTIADLMTKLAATIAQMPAGTVPPTANWQQLLEAMDGFATPQARNAASVGNLIWTGDMLPILSAVGASVAVRDSAGAVKTVSLSTLHNQAERYQATKPRADAFVTTLLLPACTTEASRTHFGAFKQGLGRALENRGIASAGFRVSLDDKGAVESAGFVLGGAGPDMILASLSKTIVGKPWSHDTLKAELPSFLAEIPLDELSYGGRPEWRKTLYFSFLQKFLAMSGATGLEDPESIAQNLPRPLSSGVQTFEVPAAGGITLTTGAEFCSGSGDIVQGKPDALGRRAHTHKHLSSEPSSEYCKCSSSLCVFFRSLTLLHSGPRPWQRFARGDEVRRSRAPRPRRLPRKAHDGDGAGHRRSRVC